MFGGGRRLRQPSYLCRHRRTAATKQTIAPMAVTATALPTSLAMPARVAAVNATPKPANGFENSRYLAIGREVPANRATDGTRRDARNAPALARARALPPHVFKYRFCAVGARQHHMRSSRTEDGPRRWCSSTDGSGRLNHDLGFVVVEADEHVQQPDVGKCVVVANGVELGVEGHRLTALRTRGRRIPLKPGRLASELMPMADLVVGPPEALRNRRSGCQRLEKQSEAGNGVHPHRLTLVDNSPGLPSNGTDAQR